MIYSQVWRTVHMFSCLPMLCIYLWTPAKLQSSRLGTVVSKMALEIQWATSSHHRDDLARQKFYLGWALRPLCASQTFCINNCINKFECPHTQRCLHGKDANHSTICCKGHCWKVKGITLHTVLSSLSYIDSQGEFYPWKLSEFQTGTAFRGD